MDVSPGACKSEELEILPPVTTLKSLEDPQGRSVPVDESTETVKDILVRWDFETCPIISPSEVPSLHGAGATTTSLLQELQRCLKCEQIRVTINVYGNGGPGSKSGLDSFIASGITLQHRILPCKQPGLETAALKTMIVDIALWALSSPAPKNVFLISAAKDTSFRDLVSGLHIRDYNIHLATKYFGCHGTEQRDDSGDVRSLFNPMPRYWSVSKQVFVVRTAPSGLGSVDASQSQNALPVSLNSQELTLPT